MTESEEKFGINFNAIQENIENYPKDFGSAIKALKSGYKISRKDYGEKHFYIMLKNKSVELIVKISEHGYIQSEVSFSDFDVLAEDWYVLQD